MNGECETYRLNEPMKWEEFIAMPLEHQVTYVKKLRKRFNVPDLWIAKMFGVSQDTISRYTRKIGIPAGKRSGREKWDKDQFWLFMNGYGALNTEQEEESISSEEVDFICEQTNYGETQYTHYDESVVEPVPFEENDPVPEFEDTCKTIEPLIPITPCSGTMSFEGNFEDVLKALSVMIGSGNGKIHIAWDVA